MKLSDRVSKHSPQIFLAVGIAGFVGAVVTAVIKAEKVKPIIDETVDNVKAATFDDDRFGFKNRGEEVLYKASLVSKAVLRISKEMSISIGLCVFSTSCILKAFDKVTENQVALVGTINGLDSAIKTIQTATKEEVGEETYKKIEDRIFVKHITDQLNAVRKGDTSITSNDVETFTRYFSKETSNKFPEGGADTVLPFLKAAETYFNQLLHSRERNGRPGVVYFNEVLDYLGFAKVPEGKIAGWISYGGKGFIDFGIIGAYYADYDGVLDRYNCVRDTNKIPRSDSGYLLCFNVDPCVIK